MYFSFPLDVTKNKLEIMTFLFQCYFHVIFQSIGGSTSAQSTEENRLKAENLKTEGRLIL